MTRWLGFVVVVVVSWVGLAHAQVLLAEFPVGVNVGGSAIPASTIDGVFLAFWIGPRHQHCVGCDTATPIGETAVHEFLAADYPEVVALLTNTALDPFETGGGTEINGVFAFRGSQGVPEPRLIGVPIHAFRLTVHSSSVRPGSNEQGFALQAQGTFEILGPPQATEDVTAALRVTQNPSWKQYPANGQNCAAGFSVHQGYELRNVSQATLSFLQLVVTALPPGYVVRNGDDGPGGVGTMVSVPVGGTWSYVDGALSPSQATSVVVKYCIPTRNFGAQRGAIAFDVVGVVE